MKKTITIVAVVMLIAVIAVLGVGCKKLTDKLYAPKNIAYDGQYITWDKVDLGQAEAPFMRTNEVIGLIFGLRSSIPT